MLYYDVEISISPQHISVLDLRWKKKDKWMKNNEGVNIASKKLQDSKSGSYKPAT